MELEAAGDGPAAVALGVLAELGFPLPLNVADLCTYLGLELHRDPGLPEKVRGVLDVRERLIVLRSGLHPSAEGHVICHEGGHYGLPTHRALLYRCSEFDLSERARRRMEFEANLFAVALRFGALPKGAADSVEPSIAAVRRIADTTEASFESALRWWISQTHRPVWAVMCEPVSAGAGAGATGPPTDEDHSVTLVVRYGYRSRATPALPWPRRVRPTAQSVLGLRRADGPLPLQAGPADLQRYRRHRAGWYEVFATDYWTCVLVW